MGNPALYYNSKTIQFPWKAYDLQLEYPHHRISNRSASKIPEILNVSPDVLHQIKMRLFENEKYPDIKRTVYQWWEWAMQGFSWQFALDSDRTVWTTLASSAASGSTTCNVSSTTGIVVGNQYVIRNKLRMQTVKVVNVIGATVTMNETLDYSFAAGARFRDELFWPAVLYVVGTGQQAPQHAIREKPPLHFDVELLFSEDVTTL